MKILVFLLLVIPELCFSQGYPTKPVRWIVPTGPGSAVDVNARRVTPKLAELLGQPVVVENRPGANSMIGAREAARSAPDGYTVFQAVVNNAINDALSPDPCCVLNDKLIAVTRLYTTPLVMVTHPGVSAATMKDYVALAKEKPNTLTYASGGAGSITQMVGELLKLTAKIQVREIPYKAIGAELPDLSGGHVSTAFLSPVVIADHVRSGKLHGIAVAGRERLAILPNVPTMAEAGYPIEGLGWNGIFVPAGTPAPIIARLQQDISRVLADKDIQEDAQRLGTLAGGEAPEQFAAFVRGEVRKWGQVIKDAGIKVE